MPVKSQQIYVDALCELTVDTLFKSSSEIMIGKFVGEINSNIPKSKSFHACRVYSSMRARER